MARIRPDQIEHQPIPIDTYSMNYLLEEMKLDAEEQKKMMERVGGDTTPYDAISNYLTQYQQLVNGINPSTGEPFTDMELRMIQFFEEALERVRRFDETRGADGI